MDAVSRYRSRAEALYSNASKYYTGKPCMRGHYADRYALNSGCTECMRRTNIAIRQEINDAPNPRRDAIEELAHVGMRLFHEDVPVFTDVAAALVVARFPVLKRADVIGKGKHTGDAAGTGFYPFRIHPSDLQMLRAVAAAYCSAHVRDTSGVIAARLAAVVEVAVKARDSGIGEWKFT